MWNFGRGCFINLETNHRAVIFELAMLKLFQAQNISASRTRRESGFVKAIYIAPLRLPTHLVPHARTSHHV